jgi:hypothetical protein
MFDHQYEVIKVIKVFHAVTLSCGGAVEQPLTAKADVTIIDQTGCGINWLQLK